MYRRKAFLLALTTFFGLLSFSLPARQTRNVYLDKASDLLYFGNDSVELVIDATSGYFQRIRNKRTGIDHKPQDQGVWPYGLTVGTRENPDMMRADILPDRVQKMTHRLEERSAASVLRLEYSMLLDNKSKSPTGVGLGVEIELAPKREYFSIRSEIANGGGWWVTNFYAGKGQLVTGDSSPENERVRIPTHGTRRRTEFKGTSLGLPTYTWGWTDYSGERGGIGMGYVNDSGIQLMFDIQPAGSGVSQSWRLFDTRGYWHFERSMNDYQKSLLIQPLEPANNFTTGEWLIVPHSGDWHQTADVYRERLLKTFAGDYQSWDTLPQRVKDVYVQFGFFIADNSIGNAYPRKVRNHTETIIPQMRAALEPMGLEPRNASANLIFFHPNVGRYPEFFPVWEPAGGDKGLKQTIAGLHKMGIKYVIGYTHLSYNHPAAKNYVYGADVHGTSPPTNPTAGLRACIDNSAWIRLWKERLIPAYASLGFDGVYADEGHFPWGTCSFNGPDHLHGPTAVGILTANTRGSLRLFKMLHERLGPQSVIMVEGSGDVSGRWADADHAYPDPAVAYTLPFKRYMWYVDVLTPDPKISEQVNIAVAHGYALMPNLENGKKISDFTPFRRYVATRKRIEAASAPGYPQGFRDTVGLKWTNRALEARAFRDPVAGITVVYYATAPVDTELELDGAALGYPKIGTQRQRVKLDKDGVDFWIVK